jgi:hypothetical protein
MELDRSGVDDSQTGVYHRIIVDFWSATEMREYQ